MQMFFVDSFTFVIVPATSGAFSRQGDKVGFNGGGGIPAGYYAAEGLQIDDSI